MRNLYQPLSRKKRAEQSRKDAEECHKAGFEFFARLNWEIAEMLDPYVEEEYPEDRS